MTAIDFPTANIVGEEFTAGGITYIWNGQGWTVKPPPPPETGGGGEPIDAFTKAESIANFVNVPGDAMTGPLQMGNDFAVGNKIQFGDFGHAIGRMGDTGRLVIGGGQDKVEITTVPLQLALNPTQPLHATTKQYVDAADSARVMKAGDTMTGALSFYMPTPGINFHKTNQATEMGIVGYNNSDARWLICPGNGNPETGGNAGSDFTIIRYADTGNVSLSTPFTINRSNGNVWLGGAVFVNGDVLAIGSPATSQIIYGGDRTIYRAPNGIHQFDNVSNTVAYMTVSQGGLVSHIGYIEANTGGVRAGGGLLSKAGSNGAYGFQLTNFNWTGVMQTYVGDVHVGDISWISDYRTKKNIVELPSMWAKVKALRPISYSLAAFTPPVAIEQSQKDGKPFMSGDDVVRWGFVAHELQETLVTSAATGVKDSADAIQSPNMPVIVAALTKALQEAMTQIEALESALSATAVEKRK